MVEIVPDLDRLEPDAIAARGRLLSQRAYDKLVARGCPEDIGCLSRYFVQP